MKELERYKINTETFIKDGNYGQGIIEAKKGIKEFPEDLYFQWLLALSYKNSEDNEKALKVYKEIISKDLCYVRAHIGYIELMERLGKNDKVLVAYENLNEEDKNSGSSLFLYSHVIDDDELVLKMCRKAMKKDPELPWAYLEASGVLERTARREEALEVLTKGLSVTRDSFALAYLYAQLGYLYREKGDIERALEYFKLSLKANNLLAYSYFNIGYLLGQDKKFEEELSYYLVACNIYPFKRLYLYNIGDTLCDLGKYKEALKFFDRAITAYGELGNASIYLDLVYLSRGWTLNETGKIKEAIKNYKKSLELNPKNKKTYVNLYHSYYNLKDYIKARFYLKETEELTEDRKGKALILSGIGNTLLDEGRYEDAIKEFKNAIKLDPDCSSAYFNFGATLKKMNKLKEALNCWKKVIQIGLDKGLVSESYNRIAAIYIEEGKYDDAIKSCEEAINDNPKSSNSYIKLAVLNLLSKGDEVYALNIVEKIKQINSDITDKEILCGFAGIYALCSQHKKLISTCEKLLRLYSDTKEVPNYYLFMAYALNKMEQREKAEEMIKRGLELTKDKTLTECFYYVSASIELGRNNITKAKSIISKFDNKFTFVEMIYYLKKGKVKKAKLLLRKLLKQQDKLSATFDAPTIIQSSYRKNAILMAYNNLGFLSLYDNEYDRAIVYLEKSLQISPSDPCIHWFLYSIYSRFGVKDKKKYHLQKAIDGYKQIGANLWSMYLEVTKIVNDYAAVGHHRDRVVFQKERGTVKDEGLLKDSSFYKLLIKLEKLYRVILKDLEDITKWTFLVSPGLSYAYSEDYTYHAKNQATVDLFRIFCRTMSFVIIVDQGLAKKIPLIKNMRVMWDELYKKIRFSLKSEIHKADLDVMYCAEMFERICLGICIDVKTKNEILSLYDEAIASYKKYRKQKDYLATRYKKCWAQEKISAMPNNKIIDEYRHIAAQAGTKRDLLELKKECLFRVGGIYLYRKNPKEAREYLIKSINIIELMRKRLKNVNQIRSAWFAKNIDIYAKCIEANYLLGNFNELLFLIESSQNRDLLDNILNKRIAFQLLPQRSVDFEKGWFFSVAHSIVTAFKRKKEERSDPFLKIGRDFWTNLENLKNPHKIISGISQVKDISSRKVAILEYFYHKADLYIYLVKVDKGQVRVFHKGENIDELIQSLFEHNYEIYEDVKNSKRRQQKTWINRNARGKELMLALSKVLLPDEIMNEIAGYDTLIIVPFGALHYVPFNCLIDKAGKYLFESKTVLQNPSLISFLKCTSTSRGEKNSFSFMNIFCGIGMEKYQEQIKKIKDLREGVNIYPHFDTDINFQQNKKDFLKYYDQSQNLLLFSHFVTSQRDPFSSSFCIGGEYIDRQAIVKDELTLEEIIRKCDFKNLEFLILAGCNTELSHLQFNELIGAATIFMWKGVPAILSSMWPLNPKVNKYFDDKFYSEFLKNGKSKMEAYGEAQNHLYRMIKNDPRNNQILFLSPWVLMGNPF